MAINPEAQQAKPIQVVGDPTVDWMIIRKGMYSSDAFWQDVISKTRSNIGAQPGGSALLTNLLEAVYPSQVAGVELTEDLLRIPNTGKVVCTYTIWEEAHCVNGGFRIKEWLDSDLGRFNYEGCQSPQIPQTLVIEDSNLGFRDTPRAWPAALESGVDASGLQHVIFKSSMFHEPKPGDTPYSRIISRGLAGKTTLLLPVSDLRKCPIYIGKSLSWERMLEQIIPAVLCDRCPFTKDGALAFARVIVSIGLSGAVMLEPGRTTLVFDRQGQEGDWQKQYSGSMMGYNTCLTVALVKAAHDAPAAPDWPAAIKRGLLAARELHRVGYQIGELFLSFPTSAILDALSKAKEAESAFAAVSASAEEATQYSTLLDYELSQKRDQPDPTYNLAARIVKEGPYTVLTRVPVESVEQWSSADRLEIEGICSIRNLIQDYVRGDRAKPLSIAVFGPPGAGKSFAIKQVAKSFVGERFAEFSCNLSQYSSPSELVGAFHQIRDINLRGQIPLVFWDEFDGQLDNQTLGWLRYFLAPMQDGVFLDQGLEHPVGSGIYVFAGGTADSYLQFTREMHSDAAKLSKLPDFVSRLKGYVDIKGVNPNPHSIQDHLYVIRRAFALRAILKSLAPSIFAEPAKRDDQNMQPPVKEPVCRIDEGVLRALLNVTRYKHGVRSLESIVAISNLRGKGSYELSSLPPDSQLELHVDAQEFRALTQTGKRGKLFVGVTGHRFLAQVDKLQAGIRQALDAIAARFPGQDLLALTPLAQGADRLLTAEILQWQEKNRAVQRLIAVLPFDSAEYEKDFKGASDYETANLIQEYRYFKGKAVETIQLPGCATREDAYLQCGWFIADSCDVLLALWDGDGSQGIGGTGEIVERARQHGIPVYVVRAGNRKPGTFEPTVHKEQGKLIVENT